jgi:hypothetical protein
MDEVTRLADCNAQDGELFERNNNKTVRVSERTATIRYKRRFVAPPRGENRLVWLDFHSDLRSAAGSSEPCCEQRIAALFPELAP